MNSHTLLSGMSVADTKKFKLLKKGGMPVGLVTLVVGRHCRRLPPLGRTDRQTAGAPSDCWLDWPHWVRHQELRRRPLLTTRVRCHPSLQAAVSEVATSRQQPLVRHRCCQAPVLLLLRRQPPDLPAPRPGGPASVIWAGAGPAGRVGRLAGPEPNQARPSGPAERRQDARVPLLLVRPSVRSSWSPPGPQPLQVRPERFVRPASRPLQQRNRRLGLAVAVPGANGSGVGKLS